MPLSILSSFVCLGFLKDDVMKKIKDRYHKKNLWNFKAIFKSKNHFNESLKQICFEKLKQLLWTRFMKDEF